MGFHINTTGYIDTAGARPSRAQGGCSCGDHRGPDPAEGGALVQAMQALMVAAKVDQVLERHAPLHTMADKPLGPPRGVLDGKAHSAPERATQRHADVQAHDAPAKTTIKPTASAPLRPRGILSGEG